MFINFDPGLANADGTVVVSVFESQSCIVSEEGPGICLDGSRRALGTASAVPLPAAIWLFTSTLVLLGWMRKRTLL